MRLGDVVFAPFLIPVCFVDRPFVLRSRGENCLLITRRDLDELR